MATNKEISTMSDPTFRTPEEKAAFDKAAAGGNPVPSTAFTTPTVPTGNDAVAQEGATKTKSFQQQSADVRNADFASAQSYPGASPLKVVQVGSATNASGTPQLPKHGFSAINPAVAAGMNPPNPSSAGSAPPHTYPDPTTQATVVVADGFNSSPFNSNVNANASSDGFYADGRPFNADGQSLAADGRSFGADGRNLGPGLSSDEKIASQKAAADKASSYAADADKIAAKKAADKLAGF